MAQGDKDEAGQDFDIGESDIMDAGIGGSATITDLETVKIRMKFQYGIDESTYDGTSLEPSDEEWEVCYMMIYVFVNLASTIPMILTYCLFDLLLYT